MLYLVAVLMLVTALVMLQVAKKRSAPEQTQEPSSANRNSTRFASVRLCCDKHACSSAQSMRDKVFLASEAPALPLAACDAIHCQCKYAKASDRRATGGRRAIDIGIQPLIFDGAEHRQEDRRDAS